MTPQRSFIPMDEGSQEYSLHRGEFSAVCILYGRDALGRKDSAFLLINSFVGRRASGARICLITGIYSVFSLFSRDLASRPKSLHGLLRRKRNATAFGGKQGETGGLPLRLLLFMLATPSHGILMRTLSLCPAYACKSPSRGHRDDYWETVHGSDKDDHLCDGADECPTLPHPVRNSALRWEAREK